MQVKIIKIGNSRGIRIPQAILKQFNFDESAEMDVEEDKLVIKSKKKVREGWSEAFESMPKNKDDKLILENESILSKISMLSFSKISLSSLLS